MRTTLASFACAAVALVGCSQQTLPTEPGESRQANFVNGGFETGSFTSGWTVTTAQWGDGSGTVGFNAFPPTQLSDLKLTTGVGTNFSAPVVGPVPATLTAADSLKLPFDGTYSAQVNGAFPDKEGKHNANILQQSMTVVPADVDQSDGKVHVRFAVAPVLNNPNADHSATQQPYFFIEIRNTTKNTQLFNTFNFTSQPGVGFKTAAVNYNSYPTLYTDWQTIDVSPGSGGIAIGDTIQATVVASGCSFNAHYGEAFVDDFSTSFNFPTVQVSAPAFTTAGSTVVYTVTAKNGSTTDATNAVVDFATPMASDSRQTSAGPRSANTTLNTFAAPAGVTCSGLTAGNSGTLTCNLGTIPAGQSKTFTVTINVPTAATFAGWTGNIYLNEGNYHIVTTQRPTPVGGGVVQTQVVSNTLVDLQTTLTDGKTSINYNRTNSYTLVVTNKGPAAVSNVSVKDTQPSAFSGTTWTCVASAGATCTASGMGAINDTVSLPLNGTVTYTVNTTITGGPAAGTVTYSASATPPSGTAQSVLFDNVASDTDNVSQAMFTLTAAKDGANTGTGTITSSPAGINCGATCSASFAENTVVALTATPDAGSVFTGWSGGGCGTANPCNVTVTANTTVTAKFGKPSFTTTLAATSNANSTSVRPGDTADYQVVITIPKGTVNYPLTVTDTFPTGLSYVSNTTPTTTGALTCTGSCATPTVMSAANVTNASFGNVSCTAAADCTVTLTIRGRVAATATRGTTLVDQIAITGLPAKNQTTLTVIEPNLTIGRVSDPASDLGRGATATITVTVANNTGGANAPAYGVVATFPTPAGFTAQGYGAGTCPTATPDFTGGNAKFTFPTDATGAIAASTSCTFTYQLVEGTTIAGNSTVTIPAGTVTSKSLTGAAPPAKAYNGTAPSFTITTPALPNNEPCTAASECVSVVCDVDGKCGYDVGHGSCAGDDAKCRSNDCSANNLCLPNGGCYVDDDCDTTTKFCNTETQMCTNKLPNGTGVPVITGHTPVLDGMCTTGVATVVCTSAVCDEGDDQCGYPNGGGTCDTANGATVCRSGACDTADSKCGYVNGDGPCDATNGSTVCRSGVCDTADSKCGFANGDGACDATNALTVCRSGVCGSDGKCGLVDGDPTCTSANAATVCRTGICGSDGTCGAGCRQDSECDTSHQFCNTEVRTCVEKLPNGTKVPTIGKHTPPLAGTCSTAVSAVVCASAVCDPADDSCGFLNGDGTCDGTTAATVCRSGACGSDGKCGLIDGEACTGTTVCRSSCNEQGSCGPTAQNPDMASSPDMATPGQIRNGITGGGFTCAMGGPAGDEGALGMILLALASLAILWRRRSVAVVRVR